MAKHKLHYFRSGSLYILITSAFPYLRTAWLVRERLAEILKR